MGTGSKGSVRVGSAPAFPAMSSGLIVGKAARRSTLARTSVISAICAGGNSHGKCVPGVAFVDVEQLGQDGTLITTAASTGTNVATTCSPARRPADRAVVVSPTRGVLVVCLGGKSHM